MANPATQRRRCRRRFPHGLSTHWDGSREPLSMSEDICASVRTRMHDGPPVVSSTKKRQGAGPVAESVRSTSSWRSSSTRGPDRLSWHRRRRSLAFAGGVAVGDLSARVGPPRPHRTRPPVARSPHQQGHRIIRRERPTPEIHTGGPGRPSVGPPRSDPSRSRAIRPMGGTWRRGDSTAGGPRGARGRGVAAT